MLEAYIEQTFCEKLKQKYYGEIEAIKIFKKGWPDRMVVLPDTHVLWIEFKRPDGTIQPCQVKVHEFLKSIGHKVYICRSSDHALGTVYKALKRGY